MTFKHFLILALALFSASHLSAQTEDDQIVESIIESIAADREEGFDFSELVERLNFFRRNPIDLNATRGEELRELHILTPLEVYNLIAYRERNGKLIDLLELQAVDGFNIETIRRLLPFISLKGATPLSDFRFSNLINKGTNDLMITVSSVLQKQQGYLRSDSGAASLYGGNPFRVLARYRYHLGPGLSASFTTEKDAGEAFFSDRRGLDFYSGNISYRGNSLIKKVTIGDYSLQFGQGLTMWTGLGFGKGPSVAAIVKNESGLKPYSSTNESLFMRGAAATFSFKKVDITTFVSSNLVDASIDTADDSGVISSLQQSGLHRTSKEAENRKSVNQAVYGTNAVFSAKSLHVGATVYQTNFSRAFARGKALYNEGDFSSSRLINTGAYYDYSLRNFYLFGELAHSIGSGYAYLNGAIITLSPGFSLVLQQRDYQRNYQSFFNQALAENSSGTNEKGFYSGFIINPGRKIELSGYLDSYRFPGLKFRVDAPSSGYELFSQLIYSYSKRLRLLMRYKFEQKQQNDDLDNVINHLVPLIQQAGRFEIQYNLNKQFELKNRAELTAFRKDQNKREYGFLLYQDVVYNPMRSSFSGNVRFSVFNTEGFNTRIYTYENDVLYGFSAPAFDGQGTRFYVNGRYHLKKGIDLWGRYSLTRYLNKSEIGTAGERIAGNMKSDFKLQLRMQF